MKINPYQVYMEKAAAEAEAYEMALGTYRLLNNGSVVPLATDAESREEFERIANLVSSVGPKILTRKQDGIIGSITVTGSDEIKTYLDEEYDLRFLVERVVRDGIVKGSMGLALGIDEDRNTYVYRLGGYITRLFSDVDVDRQTGILQIEANETELSYEVRIFIGNRVQHWTNVRSLTGINWNAPHNEYENDVDVVAFFADYQSDDTGMSIGEMEQLVPILKGIMAVEARIHRVSEIFGFPKAVVSGTIQQVENSPTSVLHVSEGGSVNYLTPASFDNLIRQKVDLFNELNEIATLPSGFVGRGNQPSGEAIKEANSAFNASISRYARSVSRLFTNAFYEFFKSQRMNVEGFSITINPNILVDRTSELDKAIELLEKGLLTPEVVVALIARIYEVTDDVALEILKRYREMSQIIPPDEILNQL